MARRIEHRSQYAQAPDIVYSALVDREYLRDRLAVLGGKSAAVLSHEATPEAASYRLRHGVDAKNLPSPVRAILPGDLTIERAESWRKASDGAYQGTVHVTIPGMPGDLKGTLRLGAASGGSVMVVDGSVSVPIPLFGGKVEDSVGGHLIALLEAEHEFTVKWLAEHSR
ncbi:MAG: DUF2505 domain-containing protein [Sciscionella sp.]